MESATLPIQQSLPKLECLGDRAVGRPELGKLSYCFVERGHTDPEFMHHQTIEHGATVTLQRELLVDLQTAFHRVADECARTRDRERHRP